jgi:hypothetical protein
MSYYMRFIITDAVPLDLSAVDALLKSVDPAFTVRIDPMLPEAGDLLYRDTAYAIIEINRPGDEIFDEDIDELKEAVDFHDDPRKADVLAMLNAAQQMIALEIMEAGDENLVALEPFWDALFARYKGLLQVDEEGFFDRDGRVLSLI